MNNNKKRGNLNNKKLRQSQLQAPCFFRL